MVSKFGFSQFDKLAADRLALAVARLVEMRVIDARSEAGDALLDYLKIGGIDGPSSVPEWVENYLATSKRKAGE